MVNLNKRKSKLYKNYAGLLKKRNGYHFLNSFDLIHNFITQFYPNDCVVVILDCKNAFKTIPKLNILKRDDLSTYLLGTFNEIVLIEFANIKVAEDYVFSFPNNLIQYFIFNNCKLIRDEKGLTKK
jgi:hypothetical protein